MCHLWYFWYFASIKKKKTTPLDSNLFLIDEKEKKIKSKKMMGKNQNLRSNGKGQRKAEVEIKEIWGRGKSIATSKSLGLTELA